MNLRFKITDTLEHVEYLLAAEITANHNKVALKQKFRNSDSQSTSSL